MFIAIEGVTGIGKSTLQNVLSNCYRSETLIQDFEKHPYLVTSDEERLRDSLEREVIFLFMAYHQLKFVDFSTRLIISDFIFEKLQVFATTSLSPIDLEKIYIPSFDYLRRTLRKPELIIRLTGSPDFALSNIRERGRPGEQYLTEIYLANLDQAFDTLFQKYNDCKVLKVNAEEYDFLYDDNAVRKLCQLIEFELPELTAYKINS